MELQFHGIDGDMHSLYMLYLLTFWGYFKNRIQYMMTNVKDYYICMVPSLSWWRSKGNISRVSTNYSHLMTLLRNKGNISRVSTKYFHLITLLRNKGNISRVSTNYSYLITLLRNNYWVLSMFINVLNKMMEKFPQDKCCHDDRFVYCIRVQSP